LKTNRTARSAISSRGRAWSLICRRQIFGAASPPVYDPGGSPTGSTKNSAMRSPSTRVTRTEGRAAARRALPTAPYPRTGAAQQIPRQAAVKLEGAAL
jgi:hypothetical protein